MTDNLWNFDFLLKEEAVKAEDITIFEPLNTFVDWKSKDWTAIGQKLTARESL